MIYYLLASFYLSPNYCAKSSGLTNFSYPLMTSNKQVLLTTPDPSSWEHVTTSSKCLFKDK